MIKDRYVEIYCDFNTYVEPKNLGSSRLLFSDDDDLWGPERIRLYGIIIDQHGRVPGVTAAT